MLPGSLPQHSGLLHIQAYGEKDLYALYGGLLCCLHLNVYLRNDLPHLQEDQKVRQKEEGDGHADIRGESRVETSLDAKVIQIQKLRVGGSYSLSSEPHQ